MEILYGIGSLLYFGACYLVAHKIGEHRTIGFTWTFIIGVAFTPLAGYLAAESAALKKPRGCLYCGNRENEAEYCGVCGKNDNGDTQPVVRESFGSKLARHLQWPFKRN